MERLTSNSTEQTKNRSPESNLLRRVFVRLSAQHVGRFNSQGRKYEQSDTQTETITQNNAEHVAGMHAILHEVWNAAEKQGDKSITGLDYRLISMYINDHDLAENETGDISTVKTQDQQQHEKYAAKAISESRAFADGSGEAFLKNYTEYSGKATPEAELVKSIDILEALSQMIFAGRMDLFRYSSVEEMDQQCGVYFSNFQTTKALYEYLRRLYKKRNIKCLQRFQQ